MGNVLSSVSGSGDATGNREEMAANEDVAAQNEEFHDTVEDLDDQGARAKAKEAEMEEFRRQLQNKREQRREILDRHKAEKKELEVSLEKEKRAKLEAFESNRKLRALLIQNNIEIPEDLQSSKENLEITSMLENMKEEFEKLKTNNIKLRRDLAETNSSLQEAYSDIADLNVQNTESMKQVTALKEVIAASKTMLNLREQQLNELKSKLNDIERSLADREASMLSEDLRQEYRRQLENIRNLRTLYEERARLAEVTRQGLVRELEEQKLLKQAEINRVKDLKEKIEDLEARVDELQEIISNKNNQIYTCQDETRGLKEEMSAVNKLFSQVLLGYKSPQDLDKLVHRLEENHGLLTHMAENENDSEASSALPKLLLEIVSQVDEQINGENVEIETAKETVKEGTSEEQTESTNLANTTAEEIVQNLPKVWRVLMELLSHQSAPDDNSPEKITTCYKTVETKSGPVLVPSVSQTYIRLKDLIVEKLALIKEVNRMKQLNGHLETRLEEQEKRLCLVTNELSKTWHVVGRLRRHHHQLHTHEKILKYELQQKRKLLNELKEELEYCREKWEQAREKNTQSERDWKKLRAEFTSRKTKSSASFNNSAESGYSDERPSEESSESNDESEHVTEPLIRSKKRFKKSFETIVDSSTDVHLAAEREDPASDLLDVADLPLDTQDGDDHHDISDSCNSESLLKSEKVCEETEDEAGDLANDSSVEESSNTDHSQDGNHAENSSAPKETATSTVQNTIVPTIDPAAILKSIREQNERLARKDKKLEKLEKNSAALLQQTRTTAKISNQLNDTLDHIINRPSTSRTDSIRLHDQSPNAELESQTENANQNIDNVSVVNDSKITSLESSDEDYSSINGNSGLKGCCSKTITGGQVPPDDISNDKAISELINSREYSESKTQNEPSISDNNNGVPSVDFKAILENVKRQNERLAKKDERLENLEQGCSAVLKNLSETLTTGDEMIQKLNSLHVAENDETEEKPEDLENTEPSTSSAIDHEARFAARDLRLKRLEEQTKSLVKKVNKTTSKGVKIHYKLEELHNIYGSENSRASTPSDEDRCSQSTSNEDNNENNSESQDNPPETGA